jgi:hypothetical protein
MANAYHINPSVSQTEQWQQTRPEAFLTTYISGSLKTSLEQVAYIYTHGQVNTRVKRLGSPGTCARLRYGALDRPSQAAFAKPILDLP